MDVFTTSTANGFDLALVIVLVLQCTSLLNLCVVMRLAEWVRISFRHSHTAVMQDAGQGNECGSIPSVFPESTNYTIHTVLLTAVRLHTLVPHPDTGDAMTHHIWEPRLLCYHTLGTGRSPRSSEVSSIHEQVLTKPAPRTDSTVPADKYVCKPN